MIAFKETKIKDSFFETTWYHKNPVPESLKTVSVDVFEKILSIAADTLFHFNEANAEEKIASLLSQNTKQLELERATEIEKLRKGYETTITKLRAEVEASSSLYEALSSKMRTFETDIQKKYIADIQFLKDDKESQYQNEMRRLQEQHRETILLLQTTLEKQYKTQMELERTILSKEWTKLEELKQSLQTNRASSTKGQEGEGWFEDLVKTKTSWDPLVNTSKEAHATDRSGRIGKCAVLFEIKNYSNTVPTKEVTKFLRDMEEHRDVPFGVFISRSTGITGMKSFLKTEWTKSGQLLLFIANMDSHSPEDLLSYIETCSACAFRIYTLHSDLENSKEESDTIHEMSMRFDKCKIYVERELKRVADLSLQMTNDKKLLVSTIEKNYTTYKLQIEEGKHNLQEMLDIILNKVSEQSESEPLLEQKEKKEKKKRGKKSDVVE